MSSIDTSSIWSTIKARPSAFKRIAQRNNIEGCMLDSLLSDVDEVQDYIENAKHKMVKYGIYPVPSSVVSIDQVAADTKLPVCVLSFMFDQYGTMDDILDRLYVPFFSVYDTVFEQDHFYRFLKVGKKKASYIAEQYREKPMTMILSELKISLSDKYKPMSIATRVKSEQINKSAAHHRYGVKRPEMPDHSLDSLVEEYND